MAALANPPEAKYLYFDHLAYGVTQIGKMPEMMMSGINVAIGTDGNNASNYSDLMRATYLVAGIFKDARQDPQMFPAEMAYEMATLGGISSNMGWRDERTCPIKKHHIGI